MRGVFSDDDGGDDSFAKNGFNAFEIDEEYARRLEYNRKREDLQRLEELRKRGFVDEEEEDEDEDDFKDNSDSDDEHVLDQKENVKFLDVLIKVKNKDPITRNEAVVFFEPRDENTLNRKDSNKDNDDNKKKKKMYLKDVQAKQLLEEGPQFVEEEKIQTYAEKQESLKKAVRDAFDENADGEDDGEDLFKEKEGDDDDGVEEEDVEVMKKMDEYFGKKESELDEGQKFLRDYFVNQMWKDKEDNRYVEDAELDELDADEDAVENQEDYETEMLKFRHQENVGEIVMGQSRRVEGSVRKVDSSRKTQRKNKEERMKVAETERREELKRLKNVKKKEIKEKMQKVLSVAGFKEGEEYSLDAKDLDNEFDPEEYDKMMKGLFDDEYYDAEDLELDSDDEEGDGEKPDFNKEDELLGLPKDWDVIQGGDGFIATREKVLKRKVTEDVDEEEKEDEEDEEEEEEEVEEKEVEGKRKRKRKISDVQRAKEELMEDYYKLDYEDTIGDLKTRFKYAKVQANTFELDTSEILVLDDNELNQYVPLKKMAPYVEKDWEVNKYKVKEQKLKNMELFQRISRKGEEKRNKKRKKSEAVEKKPTKKAADDVDGKEEEAETSKLSRKAKRRRRAEEKKLPPNRMSAYGKP
ncbi:unnamed protein product [Cochlearia groenlandica]